MGRILAAFSFIRFSCTLLRHCFLKPKRRRTRGDPEAEVMPLPRTAVSAAKSVMATMAKQFRPLRPVAQPHIARFLGFCSRKKSVIQKKEERENRVWEAEVQSGGVCEVCSSMERETWPGMGDLESEGSLSSGGCSVYTSEDSETEWDSSEFGMGSDILSPRSSIDSLSQKQGLNPTFYGMEMSDDEDHLSLQRLRRMNSVVERDTRLKENAQVQGRGELLMNPAYGRRDSEATDTEVETKLRSLKSAVKSGCLALPASTALVGCEYIGRTSLNPTYGDISSCTSSSDEESAESSLTDVPYALPWDPSRSVTSGRPESLRESCSPHSLRGPFYRDMADGAENMGTLTWKNAIFSSSQGSDEDPDQTGTIAITDLQIQWRERIRVDSVETPKRPKTLDCSPFADPTNYLENVNFRFRNSGERTPVGVKGITKTMVTPIQSIAYDGFEEIDIKGHSIPHPQQLQQTKAPMSPYSSKGSLFTSGWRQTRWALRSVSLFLNRIEIFTSNKKK